MPIDTQQPAIRAFTRFLRRDLKGSIVRAARRHQILSEADLQTFCCLRISRWIKRRDYQRVFRVTNKQFLVESGTYPDIVVFRKDRPWAVIELKEQRLLKICVAKEEANKLKAIRVGFASHLKKMAPSTYIIYLARKWHKERGRVAYVDNSHFIHIVLKDRFKMSDEKYVTWLRRFRRLTRYDGHAHAARPKEKAALAAG